MVFVDWFSVACQYIGRIAEEKGRFEAIRKLNEYFGYCLNTLFEIGKEEGLEKILSVPSEFVLEPLFLEMNFRRSMRNLEVPEEKDCPTCNSGEFVKKRVCGNYMFLNATGNGISRKLIAYGSLEPVHTKMFIEKLDKGMTHIDIGANIGYYALLASSLVGEEGKVIAIEPIKKNVELLKRNFQINGFDNYEVFRRALSSSNGCVEMEVMEKLNRCAPSSDESDSFKMEGKNRIGVEEVEGVTLDDFLERIGIEDFHSIRMDIEGFEVEALKAMQRVLTKASSPSRFFMEVHPFNFSDSYHDTRGIFKLIESCGFRPKVWARDNLGYVSSNHLEEFVSPEKSVRTSFGNFFVMFEK